MDKTWNQVGEKIDWELEHMVTRVEMRGTHRDGEERQGGVSGVVDSAGGEEDEDGEHRL